MKRVLILTSVKTGSGHKSSANAIQKKLEDAGYDCRQIDVFPLMGKIGITMEDSYIPLTTGRPFVYFLCQRFSQYFPDIIHEMMYRRVKDGLLKEIGDYQPDLIISVQCMFTKSISYLLRKNRLNIPFYVGVIDLIDPPSVWKDKKADMTFVPTETIREKYLRNGFDPERVVVSGFPVRDDIIIRNTAKQIKEPIRILMVNPSTDLKKNVRFVKEVLRMENVEVRFACGLDTVLYETLMKMKENGELSDRIEIHEFVSNINEFLEDSHIVMTKAGPNAIIESIRSGTAVIICGHIEGQENHNYKYIVNNGYGLKCEDPEKIYDVLNDFIHNGGLKKCLGNTITHSIGNGAEFIADYVKEHI